MPNTDAPDRPDSPDPRDGPLAVGDLVLGRYRVAHRIANGGLSVIYRAQDERLCRPVCIKVFHGAGLEDPGYQVSHDQFVQEAFALSQLTHPNTLRIFDFGYLADAPIPFQVCEYMNGGTLSRLMRDTDGPLGRDQTVEIVTALCGPLAEAHGRGIIHRDVKPQNILFGIAGPGRVTKLADFGIAKLFERQHPHPEWVRPAGQGPLYLMYSPKWAAPEQLVADRDVGPATDLYSLALVALYMLTGLPLFRETDVTAAYRERRRSDELIDAATAGLDLPRTGLELLKEACCFEAESRPSDVTRFAACFSRCFARPTVRLVGHAAARGARPRRVKLGAAAPTIEGRQLRFVEAEDGQSSLECPGGARIRASFVPDAGGRFHLHVMGLNCFVSLPSGIPSAAVQLDHAGKLALLLPNRRTLADATVVFSVPAAGHNILAIGGQPVAVSTEECRRIVGLDFGPEQQCYLLYTRPAPSGSAGPTDRGG